MRKTISEKRDRSIENSMTKCSRIQLFLSIIQIKIRFEKWEKTNTIEGRVG